MPTTSAASSTVGMLMTHCFVAFRLANEWFRSLTMMPTIGGSKSIIVCHDIAMMFARPFHAVETNTTGPGSRRL